MDSFNETIPPSDRSMMPPFIVLLLLVLAALVGALLGSSLAYGWLSMSGMDAQQTIAGLNEDSPRSVRDAVRMVNLLNHFAAFTLPSLVVVLIAYKNQWWHYLRLDQRPTGRWLLLGVLFVVFSFPMAQLAYWLNMQLPLPDWMLQMEESTGRMIRGLLVMAYPGELLFNLLIIAVLPAIGEELLFRGVVQQQLQRRLRPVLAIWITAILFSAIHLQFAGFFPRMLLGAVLGYLFYWSRNLWLPIAAHFVMNGMQVVGVYFMGDEMAQLEMEPPASANWASGLVSLVITVGLGYVLLQYAKKKEPDPA